MSHRSAHRLPRSSTSWNLRRLPRSIARAQHGGLSGGLREPKCAELSGVLRLFASALGGGYSDRAAPGSTPDCRSRPVLPSAFGSRMTREDRLKRESERSSRHCTVGERCNVWVDAKPSS